MTDTTPAAKLPRDAIDDLAEQIADRLIALGLLKRKKSPTGEPPQ